MLLVGNDSRASASDEQLAELSTEANDGHQHRHDDPGAHAGRRLRGVVRLLPARLLRVDIPGHGKDKLNAAYAYGMQDAPATTRRTGAQAAGAQLLIQTISQLTGLSIDHYAEVDLLGFFKLSDSRRRRRGQPLQRRARSANSGVDLPAGVQTISGSQALAFVRQRHGLPRGDFDRIIRQQTSSPR